MPPPLHAKAPLLASISNGLPPPLIPSPLFATAAVVVVEFGVAAVVFVDVVEDDWVWVWVVDGVVFVSVFVFEEVDVVDSDDIVNDDIVNDDVVDEDVIDDNVVDGI